MLRKSTLMASLAMLFISTPVSADEHQILVLPDAYFPQTSYVSASDTIVFINKSEATITVISADEEWSTGALAPNQSAAVMVVAGMTTDFFHEGQLDENGDPAATGIISFSDVPIFEGSTDEEIEVFFD